VFLLLLLVLTRSICRMKNSTFTPLHHATNRNPWAYDGPKSSFIINYVIEGYNCLTFTQSDVAGIGVIISAVIQTLLTTAALIIVVYLDHQMDKNEVLKENKRLLWWRNSLRAFIRVSGDAALLTALALLISAFIQLPLTADRNSNLLAFQDAYFTL
jgi:hypothetical protein